MSNEEKEKTEQKLNAMNIFLQEYMYRDKHMWDINLKFFFTGLVIMFLPNLTERLKITLPGTLESNKWIFPLFGFLLALLFLYVSLSQAKRFESVSKTYNELAKSLPKFIQKSNLEGNPSNILNRPNAHILPIIMFLGLLIVDIVILIDYIV